MCMCMHAHACEYVVYLLPVSVSEGVEGVFTRIKAGRYHGNLRRRTIKSRSEHLYKRIFLFTMHVLEFSPTKESFSTCL